MALAFVSGLDKMDLGRGEGGRCLQIKIFCTFLNKH